MHLNPMALPGALPMLNSPSAQAIAAQVFGYRTSWWNPGSAFIAAQLGYTPANKAGDTFTGTVTAPKFQTATATVAGVASGVATTIYTMPSASPAMYLVSANIGSVSDAVNFQAFAVIAADNGSARLVSVSNATTQTITLVGLAIKSTQSSGVAQTINMTVTKIG